MSTGSRPPRRGRTVAAESPPGVEDRLAAAGLPPLPRLAWLEIDVDALAANVRTVRGLLAPGVRIAAVVKADGYGHGVEVASRAFLTAGAALLGVATFDEALAIRAAGIAAPTLVLFQPPTSCIAAAAGSAIEIAVAHPAMLEELVAAWRALRAADRGGRLRVHLEIDTGLTRAGFVPERAGDAARTLHATPGIDLAGVWTHLASAPDKAVTDEQVARFRTAQAVIAAAGMPLPPRHLAASGAVFAASAPHLEMIRPGLSLYGVLPAGFEAASVAAGAAASLRPAMTLKARAIRIESVPPGRTVGYGGRWRAERPSLVATLPLGYGDGFTYSATGRGEALVRGRRVPFVGSVAMDALAVDVTDVPGVTPGDEFVLLGAQGNDRIDAVELARLRTTIPYEVVVTMARRIPRVYDSAAATLGLRTLGGETLRGEGRDT